ncbi:MAG: dTMP kinase [Clostridiaceae bacterium]
MSRGLLITFEGPDGSGKTTQINLLKTYFENRGENVICVREPGGTSISEKIRAVILDNENEDMHPMCEALLYAASRAQLVHQVIKPSIENGDMVICDRFVESSIVYQGIGRGLGEDKIREINEAAVNGLKPDVTIMIMIPYEEGLKRKKKQRNLDRLENSGEEFHKKVYDGYVKIDQKYDTIKVINGDRNKMQVHKDVLDLIKKIILEKEGEI